ncbi:type IV secretion system protein TraC [Providencia rettgeri]|uniref:type IV secretion system protein TraC n=1 Tax=Providencia rettgeri TaxID=587 RepID=UPI00226E89DC|nr:type IV secretion system protein TraC [Providencia rettgeri]MCL0015775.1 type IV secretion system protein TraC [Providencia rettgeri]MCX9125404.1 type IV secretion system protein TraC [Providencia rettgeri]MCX9130008.1 type IV secretion system protein TraC [Providencia rettgeri]
MQEALFKNLFTAWREPDGNKRAAEALENMDYPSFCSLLPYRNYDAKSGLFINKTTIGFALECTPLVGANDKIVDALDYFLRNKLPRKIPLTFMLLGSKCISEQLSYGLKDFGWQGEEAEKFNHITRAFYERGALVGLDNKLNLPLSLRNYRLFVCYAEEHKKADALTLQKVNQILSIVMKSLAGASLHCEQMNDKGLLQLVREISNYRHDQIALPSSHVDPYESLNDQCADRSINVEIRPDAIYQSLSMDKGQKSQTRIMNYMLEKNPTQFALWQTGDNLSNLLDPASSVSCPFAITMTVYVEDLVKTQNEAKKKFITNNSRANSKYINWVPGVKRKAEEWGALREGLDSNQIALARYSYGITLFCEDDDDKALEAEMALMNTYTTNRLKLCPPTFMQLRNYLALFPFVMQEGLWGDMVRSGGTLRAKTFNVANLLPVVADNRICQKGLPIPSYRHQLSFLDIFERGSGLGNDNFNAAVCGTSGSGKSFLMQALIRQVLDAGGWAYVLDMGDSYKELCHSLGGVYVDARDLKFNPFAGVVDIKEAAESIRDLLIVLANPSGDMDDVSKSILLNAVQEVWEGKGPNGRKGNKVLIDDVHDYLEAQVKAAYFDPQSTVQNKMQEIIVALKKYTTKGLYGEYFNSDKPALNEQVRFTVLEMGGLQNKPDLLAAVMFSMMIFIQQRMYLTARSIKKLAVIDEGWKLLDNKSSFVADFIESGYRTARKYGGSYITISQGIADFDGEDASTAAKAAWSNSSFKIILRQGTETFRKYNQKNPDQFNPVERTIIERFPAAGDAHFSAFMLRIAGRSSFHRLLTDPISRALYSTDGDDFQFRENRMAEGLSQQAALLALAKRKFPQEMETLSQWQSQTRH